MDSDVQFLDDFQKIIRTDLVGSSFYSNNSATQFHIVDNPPVCIVGTVTSSLSFVVNNPNNTDIHLLAMDQGLDRFLAGYQGKRPEGILLNQGICKTIKS